MGLYGNYKLVLMGEPNYSNIIFSHCFLITFDVWLYLFDTSRGSVMQTKLTLRLEDSLIQQAKNYAKQHDKSLSQVVADYFHILTQQTEKSGISPITKSLIGILDSNNVDENDYKKHLEEKYL